MEQANSGNYGAVTPLRDGLHARSGTYGHENKTTAAFEDREQFAYGTLCQRPDGSWRSLVIR